MRIIILGDFHLSPEQPQIARDAMEDINRAAPDLIIPLGDFGSSSIGSPAGLEEAWSFLRALDAPLHPILGNHDLQQESGGKRAHYSMIEELRRINGGVGGGGFLEFDAFRFMFASTDPQPADSCWTIQECYVAPAQFEKIMGEFHSRRGVPIISFTHAPPIGASLRTVPTVHVRCTNAYLDQNHEAYRWEKLYRENPEFVMWFSAHYHLGHDHPDSHTNIDGTHFFQAQIHGLQTRDTTRQSRIVDIDANRITVSAIDHLTRQITTRSQWQFDGSLHALMDEKRQIMARGGVHPKSFFLSDTTLPGRVIPLSDNRFLAATSDGFLWEAELSTRSVLGTLHIGAPLSGVALAAGDVWLGQDHLVRRVPQHDLARFIRTKTPESLPGRHYEIVETIRGIVSQNDELYALGTAHRWRYSAEQDEFIAQEPLPAVPAAGSAHLKDGKLTFHDETGALWQLQDNNWKQLEEKVLLDQWKSSPLTLQMGTREIILQGNEVFCNSN